ncbi:MAG: hypothetical protein DCC67_17810, partial [Planctomycetota bacterium]
LGEHYAVYRSGGDWSWVEASLPDDFYPGPCSAEGVLRSVPWRFGGCFMERGVIRRLRLRGSVVPSAGDEAAAQRLVEELAAEQPPLTA